MRVRRVPEPRAQAVERALERAVRERLDASARLADQVMVVLAARVDDLVARCVSEVEPLDETALHEQLEDAVDGREPDGTTPAPKRVEDLLCAHAAIFAREDVEHGVASSARAVPRATQNARCVRPPLHRSIHVHDRIAPPTVVQSPRC